MEGAAAVVTQISDYQSTLVNGETTEGIGLDEGGNFNNDTKRLWKRKSDFIPRSHVIETEIPYEEGKADLDALESEAISAGLEKMLNQTYFELLEAAVKENHLFGEDYEDLQKLFFATKRYTNQKHEMCLDEDIESMMISLQVI
ncbi:hypothetical protein ABZP36_003718 [Zizania latifolia]